MPDLSQFGASGAVVLVVAMFLNFMRAEGKKRDKKDNLFVKTIKANTKAINKTEEKEAAREARIISRHKLILSATKAIPKKMQTIADTQAKILADSLKKLPAQEVEHQHIVEQKVEKRV